MYSQIDWSRVVALRGRWDEKDRVERAVLVLDTGVELDCGLKLEAVSELMRKRAKCPTCGK